MTASAGIGGHEPRAQGLAALPSRLNRRGPGAPRLGETRAAAIRLCQETTEPQRFALSKRKRGDRYLAAAVNRGHHAALGGDPQLRRLVPQRGEACRDVSIAGPDFDGQSPLPHRRQANLRLESLAANLVPDSEPHEAAASQERRVGDALGELSEPRVHVAPKRDEFKIRTRRPQLYAAAKR